MVREKLALNRKYEDRDHVFGKSAALKFLSFICVVNFMA